MDEQVHAWLSAYRSGDVNALGAMVEHYRRPLFGFILKMTEGRDDAEEIFHEAWFRAIRNLDRFREKNFLSWMFRITHNLVIDRARKAKPVEVAVNRDSGEVDNPVEAIVADPAPGPDTLTEGRDLGTRIGEAVRRLPEEQRAVFLMRTEAELPFKEIAKIQGISINTALARMQYALSKLREDLKNEYAALGRKEP